ncbi:MAG: fibronectin type III domain-containing protein [Verrucomicrobia bacterium]|nr:fibronectin type III domain-containing protein [Verrucomicrobiota bacterium]
MPQLRVLLAFCKGADHFLAAAAGTVIEGMTNNPAFPNPPVTMAALTVARDEFSRAVALQPEGGKRATAEKKEKRAALVRLMRQLAAYVQQVSDNHLPTLLTSGFHTASSNSVQTQLEKPIVMGLLNGNSGEIIARVKAVANARCYESRVALVPPGGNLGPWQSGNYSTSSRSIRVKDLIPGGLYEIQIRAIGGSTGTSDWSDPKQHRSL